MSDDFSDIKARGLERPDLDINKLKVGVKKMSNSYGIEETNDVVKFLCAVGAGVKASLADDGKITVTDAFKFFESVKSIPAFITGISEVPSELADEISDEEKAILKKTVLDSGVLEDDAEFAVMDGLDVAIKIKEYLQKYFIK